MQRRYDRPIIIQRKTVTQSPSGEEIAAWVDLAYRCFAEVKQTRGSERMTTAQEVAEQEVTFTLRFHTIPSASRPLHPEDRIIYPADWVGANEQEPPGHRVYDIVSADEIGRAVDLSVKTIRRADTGLASEPLGPSLNFSLAANSGYLALLEDI
jgi:SPP1 family predicted phage head-tail adaptor